VNTARWEGMDDGERLGAVVELEDRCRELEAQRDAAIGIASDLTRALASERILSGRLQERLEQAIREHEEGAAALRPIVLRSMGVLPDPEPERPEAA
jgi:hypothetical protein